MPGSVVTTTNAARNLNCIVRDVLIGPSSHRADGPQMLQDWSGSDDGRSWILHLRDGLE